MVNRYDALDCEGYIAPCLLRVIIPVRELAPESPSEGLLNGRGYISIPLRETRLRRQI
ncbi:MAG: hypothetical protein QXS68_07350 [Candidatus Methanomethylicaceae archaeon]